MRRLLAVVLMPWLLAADTPAPAPPMPTAISTMVRDVHGMVVSCPTWGGEWGSDAMASTLDVLKREGVDWVAIHPYATIRADGTVDFKAWEPDATHLVRPIREAHARGMKVMIKPHLAYWGSPFSWRGEITFDNDAAWQRFFTTYTAWVTQLATTTKDADAFVVATELEKTVSHGTEWRKVIGQVRSRYQGPLVFSANWDGVDRVSFWDAVDLVGVQAYYPVLDEGTAPTERTVRVGWKRIMTSMRDLSARTGRPVLFTELGYDAISSAPYKPWEGANWSTMGKDEAVQRLLTRVALESVEAEPAVVGAFLWKWFPGEKPAGNFRMSTPAMREEIRSAWGTR